MYLKRSLVALGIFLYGLVGFAAAQDSQPVFLISVFQPILAADDSAATVPLGASGGGDQIKEALVSSGGEGGEGVFDKGLSLLRSLVIFFLGLYGIYLGVSVAFGQSDTGTIVAFFVGSMMALGAQAVASLYTVLFEKGGGNAAGVPGS